METDKTDRQGLAWVFETSKSTTSDILPPTRSHLYEPMGVIFLKPPQPPSIWLAGKPTMYFLN